ncbi:IS91 family transposase [Candidatus Pollutiaquabacter sp.]|uniref:IS91 family transposase n=1 Tax=Candidatus Pollutiaquabacter sp. TaxID=3416354 RepID=UPI003C8FE955|nr:IS91 family transposase [Bacteroidota bacterium]
MRPACEVAQVIRQLGEQVERSKQLNHWQKRTLRLIRDCRTAALGGHLDQCPGCSHLRMSYNSCRNRHCPKCQGLAREDWVAARKAELLPVPYFHVVFTLPGELNRLCLYAPERVYDALFATAWSVIDSFAGDGVHLGARTGMIAILHTWGQNLSLHPHLHCIVLGGGISPAGYWKRARSKGRFLFPVKALSRVMRARMVAALRKAFPGEDPQLFRALFTKPWVVYAKRPFAGPGAVIDYLGRYTHKIAISNSRLISCDAERVRFRYKDYRDGSTKKVMELSPMEFIRRFAQHILPRGFVRIRHYGILSSRKKAVSIPQIILQLQGKIISLTRYQRSKAPAVVCPCCKKLLMRTILRFDHRGPPARYRNLTTSSEPQ